MDPERVRELDDWLARTEQEYCEEAPEDATKLWKASFFDDLPDHVVGALRFSIPLFAGHLIGRGGGSLGKVWLNHLDIEWQFTSLLEAYFDIGPVFTSFHLIFGIPIVLVWAWRCFSSPRIGNGLWAYWVMICASLFVFFMMHSHGFLHFVPMILILASFLYIGRCLHLTQRGVANILPGVEVLHKALQAIYEPRKPN